MKGSLFRLAIRVKDYGEQRGSGFVIRLGLALYELAKRVCV